MSLKVKNLRVKVGGKLVLDGVDLEVGKGEIVALVGPNGSGKSSLAYSLMGKEEYVVEKGEMALDGKSLVGLEVNERAKEGLFLAFQQPVAVEGVTVGEVVVSSWREKDEGMRYAWEEMVEKISDGAVRLGAKEDLLERGLNDGFSGGEKKKIEVLQMLSLSPKYAILDEVDSGLDKESLKIVGEVVKEMKKDGCGFLVISHGEKLLEYLKSSKVIYLKDGKVEKVSKKKGK